MAKPPIQECTPLRRTACSAQADFFGEDFSKHFLKWSAVFGAPKISSRNALYSQKKTPAGKSPQDVRYYVVVQPSGRQ